MNRTADEIRARNGTMSEPEQKKPIEIEAMMIGAVAVMKDRIAKWEGRREGTVGDYNGVIEAAELLLKAATDWRPFKMPIGSAPMPVTLPDGD